MPRRSCFFIVRNSASGRICRNAAFYIFVPMKRLTICLLAVLGTALAAPGPGLAAADARRQGARYGRRGDDNPLGSHAIYGNSAMAAFSMMPLQVSSSYLRHKGADYYAVTGYGRFDRFNLVQLGWRQYLRERGQQRSGGRSGLLAPDRRQLGRGTRGTLCTAQAAGGYPGKRPGRGFECGLDEAAGARELLDAPGRCQGGESGRILRRYGRAVADEPDGGCGARHLPDGCPRDHRRCRSGLWLCSASRTEFLFSVGAEYNLMQLCRCGPDTITARIVRFCPSFASVGVGARFLHLRLDFAYLIAPESSLMYNTYSISFGFDF